MPPKEMSPKEFRALHGLDDNSTYWAYEIKNAMRSPKVVPKKIILSEIILSNVRLAFCKQDIWELKADWWYGKNGWCTQSTRFTYIGELNI